MPLLIRLYQKHHQAGLEILAISIDTDKSKVPPFVSEYKLPFPVLFADEVDLLYEVSAIPNHIFVDRSGNIRYRQVRPSETVVEAVVEELLASPPPPASASETKPHEVFFRLTWKASTFSLPHHDRRSYCPKAKALHCMRRASLRFS